MVAEVSQDGLPSVRGHGADSGAVSLRPLPEGFRGWCRSGNLWAVGAENIGDKHLGMMQGTSPSICRG